MVDTTVHRIELGGDVDEACLSPDERATAASFVHARDRRAWASTRVAVRRILGDALGITPDRVRLVRGERGRPALDGATAPAVSFNVARTSGVALIAVSTAPAVGVDVELKRQLPNMVEVADRVLRPSAVSAIAGAAEIDRRDVFYREWVRHEARLKCRGTGLVEPEEDDGRTDDLTILDLSIGRYYAAAVAISGRGARCALVDGDGTGVLVA